MRTIRARLAGLTLLAALAAVVLAACGSSSSTSSSAAASAGSSGSGTSTTGRAGANPAARAKLQACLKQHGVTLPSRPAGARRPSGSGGYGGGGYGGPFGGGGGAGGAGGRFNNPKLRAALKACGANFGSGQSRFRPNQAAVAKFAACVKQHGYTLPKANFSGGAIYPASVERNKKFQAAAKACQADLRPSGGAGAPPGGAPPSPGSGTATTS
jgi:hypothetical protein